MRLAVSLSILLFALGCSENSWAQNQNHEDGFFLRLSAGGGFANTKLESGNANVKMSGGAGDLNFAIGAIVSPNLALHGTLFGWLVDDPDIKVSGTGGQANADLDLTAFGGGVTYYFMPSNIYVSGSVGIGKLSIKGGGTYGETDPGPVFDLTVGKEWWVSSSWALGVAGALGYHTVPEKDINGNWNGASFAVRFTATMN